MLRRVAVVRTDVSEEFSASIIRVRWLLVTANAVPISPIVATLLMTGIVPPKRWFLQEPHGVTTQKTTSFFIVTAVKI
jgi:hypothetical protein